MWLFLETQKPLRNTRPSPHGRRRGGCGRLLVIESGAAVLFDECKRRIDLCVLRLGSNHPTLAFLCDQASGNQTTQMEGQRRRWHAETRLELADSETLGSGAYQQPDDLQAGGVAELSKAAGGSVNVHGELHGTKCIRMQP